jgi:hypothetical protein
MMPKQHTLEEIETGLALLKAAIGSIEGPGNVVLMKGKGDVILKDMQGRLVGLKGSINHLEQRSVDRKAFRRMQEIQGEIRELFEVLFEETDFTSFTKG